MSRDFPGSYGNYLSGSLSVSAAPITMACWFRSDTSVPSNQSLMCVGDAGDMLTMRIRDPADNDLIALAYDGSQGFATSGTTWTTNTWHHACAVFASTTSRTSYLDGSGGSANTTSISPTISPSTLYVGRDSRSTQFPMNGEVAWPCVWNVALTAGEVAALAAGAHPLTIRPESIIGFWGPLLGTGTSPALVGNDLIETGAVSLGAGDVQLALGGAWYVSHTPAAASGNDRITRSSGDTRVTHTGGDTRVTADTGGTALVVAANAAQAEWSGHQAGVNAATTVSANLAQAQWATQQASVNAAKSIGVNLAQANWATNAAAVNAATSVAANVAQGEWTAHVAAVSLGAQVNAALAQADWTTHSATVSADRAVAAALGQANWTPHATSVTLGASVSANLAQAEWTAHAASVNAATTLAANLAQAEWTTHAASVNQGTAVACQVGSASWAALQAVIKADRNVSAAFAQAEWTTYAGQVVTGGAIVSVAAGVAQWTAYAATIQGALEKIPGSRKITPTVADRSIVVAPSGRTISPVRLN